MNFNIFGKLRNNKVNQIKLEAYNKFLCRYIENEDMITYSPNNINYNDFVYLLNDTTITSKGQYNFYIGQNGTKVTSNSYKPPKVIDTDGHIQYFNKKTGIHFSDNLGRCLVYPENVEYLLKSKMPNTLKERLIETINYYYKKQSKEILNDRAFYTKEEESKILRKINPHYEFIKNLQYTNPEILL